MGSINQNPSVVWEGTVWESWLVGRFPVGVGAAPFTAGSTGGSKDIVIPYHTHTVSHTHGIAASNTSTMSVQHQHSINGRAQITSDGDYITLGNSGVARTVNTGDAAQNHTHYIPAANTNSQSTTTAGYAGTSGNLTDSKNLPPYEAVYYWRRTA